MGLDKPPKIPGFLQAGAVAAVLVLVAAVALTARQPAPPTVAEFAPQAIEQIKQAPPEQGAAPGTGGSGGATTTTTSVVGSGASPTSPGVTTTTVKPIDVPRVRRCVGDPPRQTEDPQSPPCVPYFDGDNGGDTTKGVTATEIRVAYPPIGFGEDETLTADMVDYLNKRYEFYGRKIVLQRFDANGGGFAQPDPAAMQADAVKVDTELNAFATLAYPDRKGAEHHYYDELARRGIISSAYRAQALSSEARYQRFAPYEWNALPGVDTMFRLYGTFACRSLARRPPTHAGAPTSSGPTRIFGLLYQRTPDGSIPDLAALREVLAGCGVKLAQEFEDTSDGAGAANAALQLKTANVTTLLCVCSADLVKNNYMGAATNQAWFPEWIVSGYIDQDLDNSLFSAPAEQASHAFGISFRSKLLLRQDMAWYWAVKEMHPEKDPSGGIYYAASARYEQLKLLAAGIQLAGPKLTPVTFEAGLHKAVFPNPGAGGPPFFQARVGFPGGRHTMIDDASMYWYSVSDSGTIDPSFPGAVCYVNRGARFSVTDWPADDQPFFNQPCHA